MVGRSKRCPKWPVMKILEKEKGFRNILFLWVGGRTNPAKQC